MADVVAVVPALGMVAKLTASEIVYDTEEDDEDKMCIVMSSACRL